RGSGPRRVPPCGSPRGPAPAPRAGPPAAASGGRPHGPDGADRMSMTAPQARAELKELYGKADAIERKYPDGLTEAVNGEDYREVKRLLGEVDGLEAQLATLDEAEQQKARVTRGRTQYGTPLRPDLGPQGEPPAGGGLLTPGQQFILSPDY